jgi:hypothetical protein
MMVKKPSVKVEDSLSKPGDVKENQGIPRNE